MKYCSIDSLPLVLSVDEVAQTLEVGKSLAYALIRSGRLRSLRVGHKIRIPRSALEEFLSASN